VTPTYGPELRHALAHEYVRVIRDQFRDRTDVPLVEVTLCPARTPYDELLAAVREFFRALYEADSRLVVELVRDGMTAPALLTRLTLAETALRAAAARTSPDATLDDDLTEHGKLPTPDLSAANPISWLRRLGLRLAGIGGGR
jgi:hypothetical protein